MHLEPKGVIPPLVTPLDENQNINEKTLRKLVDLLLNSGVHGLFVLGSLGEFYALDVQEKCQVLDIVVKKSNGKVPIYAGTGSPSTRETIGLCRMAEDIGANAVAVITPFYVKLSQNELLEHFLTVARSVSLPLVIYHNPPRAGVTLSIDTLKRLSEVDNIIGILDASGDLSLTRRYIQETEDTDFSVIMAQDSLAAAGLICGAQGVVGATASVVPKIWMELYIHCKKLRYREALEIQDKITVLRETIDQETFPASVKEAMNLMGISVGPPREPVKPLDTHAKERLRDTLQTLGLLSWKLR